VELASTVTEADREPISIDRNGLRVSINIEKMTPEERASAVKDVQQLLSLIEPNAD
jgi:hypothetical protein